MPQPASGQPPCIVCGAPTRSLGLRLGFCYVYCLSCACVQLQERPCQEDLRRLYQHAYADSGHYGSDPDRHLRERSRVHEWLARYLVHLTGGQGHILEIGAGWGGLARALEPTALSYEGFEPSALIAAVPRARGLAVCIGGMAEAVQAARQPSVVVTVAVYEHLVDQDAFLRQARALLGERGHIVIQCPTAPLPSLIAKLHQRLRPGHELPSVFGSLAPPWHVCLPSAASVHLQAERNGLRVESIAPSPSGRAGGWHSALQVINEGIGRLGFHLFGTGWPLCMAHVFTLQPVNDPT